MLSEFAKEKVFWTRNMNVKLVQFIKTHPNIWDPKHHNYTSLEARDRTYAEFASKYGNEFTGQAVKDRWTNIRSTFANYLRKLRASRAKPEEEEYKINWHLWEPCQFLLSVNKKVKSDSITETTTEDSSLNAAIDYENNGETTTKPEDSSDEDLSEQSTQIDSNSKCKMIANSLLDVFKSVQNDSFGLENSKNGRTGRMVAKKLSQMNSYDAAVTSQKIMEVLLLYDRNNPSNPNNLS